MSKFSMIKGALAKGIPTFSLKTAELKNVKTGKEGAEKVLRWEKEKIPVTTIFWSSQCFQNFSPLKLDRS